MLPSWIAQVAVITNQFNWTIGKLLIFVRILERSHFADGLSACTNMMHLAFLTCLGTYENVHL